MYVFGKISVWECFKDQFHCSNKKSVIELASECAFVRCEYGCNSNEAKKIKSSVFECDKTCDVLPWDDNDNPKICDFGRPIKVQLEKSTDIATENTRFKCIFDTDKKLLENMNSYFETLYKQYELVNYPLILVDKNLIDTENGKDLTCVESMTIKQKTLYISYGYKNHLTIEGMGLLFVEKRILLTFQIFHHIQI